MIMPYHTSEADGANGALRKAWLLNKESRFKILSITHYPPSGLNGYTLRQNKINSNTIKVGYEIIVDTMPGPGLYSDNIPSFFEA